MTHINLVGERAKWFGLISDLFTDSYPRVGDGYRANPDKLIELGLAFWQLRRTR